MDWVEECGNTFNVNVLWDDMIFTTEPDHIKVRSSMPFRAPANLPAVYPCDRL